MVSVPAAVKNVPNELCTCDKFAESVAAEPTPKPVNLNVPIGILAVGVV